MKCSIQQLCRIPGAKVKFKKDPGFTYFDRFGPDVAQIALTKFWTIEFCGTLVGIDVSEHFPDLDRKPTFFHWRFEQVKVYLSSEHK